jgi:hypothetical protein
MEALDMALCCDRQWPAAEDLFPEQYSSVATPFQQQNQARLLHLYYQYLKCLPDGSSCRSGTIDR